MELNADFSKAALVRPDPDQWQPSPLPGVERLMLDRIGEEVARATSLVRYAVDSRFSQHTHDLGEEFLVLEGFFSDATGDFGPMTYVRNPPGSAHAPWSLGGTTIFVKLRQFDLADTARIVVDGLTAARQPGPAPGLEVLPLHRHGSEEVRLIRFAPGARFDAEAIGGAELLVLDGALDTDSGPLGRWSWLRLPAGTPVAAVAADPGAEIYLKTGHLG